MSAELTPAGLKVLRDLGFEDLAVEIEERLVKQQDQIEALFDDIDDLTAALIVLERSQAPIDEMRTIEEVATDLGFGHLIDETDPPGPENETEDESELGDDSTQ